MHRLYFGADSVCVDLHGLAVTHGSSKQYTSLIINFFDDVLARQSGRRRFTSARCFLMQPPCLAFVSSRKRVADNDRQQEDLDLCKITCM